MCGYHLLDQNESFQKFLIFCCYAIGLTHEGNPLHLGMGIHNCEVNSSISEDDNTKSYMFINFFVRIHHEDGSQFFFVIFHIQNMLKSH